MKKIVFFLIIFLPYTIVAQNDLKALLDKENNNTVPYISPGELVNLKNKPILLDAREKGEYDVSHLEGAKFVGYNNFKLNETTKKLPNKHDTIVVYCSLGVRSEDIAEQLIEKGYQNVYNLYGGIFEWKNTSNKVVDNNETETEKVHAYDEDWGIWLKTGEKVYD